MVIAGKGHARKWLREHHWERFEVQVDAGDGVELGWPEDARDAGKCGARNGNQPAVSVHVNSAAGKPPYETPGLSAKGEKSPLEGAERRRDQAAVHSGAAGDHFREGATRRIQHPKAVLLLNILRRRSVRSADHHVALRIERQGWVVGKRRARVLVCVKDTVHLTDIPQWNADLSDHRGGREIRFQTDDVPGAKDIVPGNAIDDAGAEVFLREQQNVALSVEDEVSHSQQRLRGQTGDLAEQGRPEQGSGATVMLEIAEICGALRRAVHDPDVAIEVHVHDTRVAAVVIAIKRSRDQGVAAVGRDIEDFSAVRDSDDFLGVAVADLHEGVKDVFVAL